MRIVYVLTSLGMGGAEKQVVALAGRMAERGYTVSMISVMPRKAEEWPAPVEVLYLNLRKTPWSALAGWLRARAFLRDFRPDIVHSHSFHANMLGRLLAMSTSGAVVISTIHNVYEGGMMRMLAYRFTDRLSRCTVAVSQAAADRFMRLGAVPAGRCVVLTNGIDVEEFSPDRDRRARMREEMGVDAKFVWLASGRIVAAKDYPNLLRALAILSETHSWAQVWIAGGWADREMARLIELPEFNKVDHMVRWLGLRRDLPALLDAADGFVSSSAWEGMPLAVGEAMAMEKLVVATDVGGVRELVGDEGFLVSPRNPEALAAGMREVMQTNVSASVAIRRAARERICKSFNMDMKPLEWESLYRDALGTVPYREGPGC
jgi:glycosyltransferase involved in cell wall biosynthesis